jgi:predicted Zn finger-like uncharacterized protein
MFTVCPKCALTLVVTAADLRVAQGYVRCGRCSSVFNALAQLSDERAAVAAGTESPLPAPEPEPEPEPEQPAAAAAEPRARGESETPRAAEAEIALISEDALEFNPEITDAASVFVEQPPSPEWTAATGSFKALLAGKDEPAAPAAQPAAGADEPVDVELDAALLSDIVKSDLGAPAAAPREAPTSSPAAPAAAETPATPAPRALPAGLRRRRGRADRASPPTQTIDEFLARASRPAAGRGTLAWGAGAALLTLALTAQVINHRRDTLAADPRFSRSLTTLYAALGVPLAPHWDLHAYDVRQLGATVEPGSQGAITVRASIRNAGHGPQPPPLLRVTLQDRFGNRLASREVAPRDYLPGGVAPPALLAVDQRIDAELAFVDPGASAVGFELDACLPATGGGIACANDPGAP